MKWLALKISLAGLFLASLGVACNTAVVHANHGLMPVFVNECAGLEGYQMDYLHACGSHYTKLIGLADWIRIGNYAYSPGDFLMTLGELLIPLAVIALIRDWIKRNKEKDFDDQNN
jgi:Family of unknown function (DUF5317)